MQKRILEKRRNCKVKKMVAEVCIHKWEYSSSNFFVPVERPEGLLLDNKVALVFSENKKVEIAQEVVRQGGKVILAVENESGFINLISNDISLFQYYSNDENLAERASDICGKIDIVIYDSHKENDTKDFFNITEEIWDKRERECKEECFFINNIIQYMAKHCVHGHIVMILQKQTNKVISLDELFDSTMKCFAKGIAKEYAKSGIVVNGIEANKIAKQAAVENLMKLISYLSSDYSNHMVGTIIPFDEKCGHTRNQNESI